MLSKIMTALRGKANETGQSVVDSQALRILDQEIRDSENHLSRSKTELTRLMGQRQLNSNKADTLESKIAELEKSAEAALDKGEEQLAVEVAERMVALQDDLEAERAIVSEYDASICLLYTSDAADDMAAEESGSSLESRLKAAGIGGQERKADDVLARLKAKKNATPE